jgi:ankyrin repeat protein
MKNIKHYTDHLRESQETPKELDQRLLGILSGNKAPDIEEVRSLIEAGADLEARDFVGQTPLHRAAENGRTEAAKALIGAGADLEAKDTDGWTPLHRATAWGRTEIAKALIGAGADLEAKDRDGQTPLHYAAAWGSTEAAKALILAGADISTAFDSLDKLEGFFGGDISWIPLNNLPPEWRRDRKSKNLFGV